MYVGDCRPTQLNDDTVYNNAPVSRQQDKHPVTRSNKLSDAPENNEIMTTMTMEHNNSVIAKRECCHYYDHGHDLMEMHNNPHHYESKSKSNFYYTLFI